MKVILLDHDGVICLPHNWGSRFKKEKKYRSENKVGLTEILPVDCRFDNFDKDCVKILNEILEETNSEIVISSDWKLYATLEELGDYYIQQGVSKKPIAFTRSYREFRYPEMDERPPYGYERDYTRYWETRDYIDQNNLKNYLIIDDLYVDVINKDTNFLRTNEYEGLKQTGLKEKIIKILNNE